MSIADSPSVGKLDSALESLEWPPPTTLIWQSAVYAYNYALSYCIHRLWWCDWGRRLGSHPRRNNSFSSAAIHLSKLDRIIKWHWRIRCCVSMLQWSLDISVWERDNGPWAWSDVWRVWRWLIAFLMLIIYDFSKRPWYHDVIDLSRKQVNTISTTQVVIASTRLSFAQVTLKGKWQGAHASCSGFSSGDWISRCTGGHWWLQFGALLKECCASFGANWPWQCRCHWQVWGCVFIREARRTLFVALLCRVLWLVNPESWIPECSKYSQWHC